MDALSQGKEDNLSGPVWNAYRYFILIIFCVIASTFGVFLCFCYSLISSEARKIYGFTQNDNFGTSFLVL